MKFLSNTHDPADPRAKMALTLSFEEWQDPQGSERAWARHLEWLAGKVIGEPQATPAYTSEELKAMGMVGVYDPTAPEETGG